MAFLGETSDENLVNGLSYALCLLMFGSFLHLAKGSTAHYGRYNSGAKSAGWGAPVNAKVAWIVQEAPSMLVPIVLYIVGPNEIKDQLANKILLGLFLFHYINRTVIFPLRIKGGKPTPFYIMLSAIAFTSINGYIQGKYLTALKAYDDDYVYSSRFLIGVIVFGLGMAINWHADDVLRNLRKPGETGYKIPYGGMFKYVSGANFFGEIIEWTGFAIACGGAPAITFALNTAFNIGPRAYQHHQWYLNKFESYHELGRCAIIPFLL